MSQAKRTAVFGAGARVLPPSAALLSGALLLTAAVGCGISDDNGNGVARGTSTSLPGGTTSAASATPAKPGTLEGFSSPESVVFAGDRWFISNIGAKQEPTAKDGDGFLTELSSVGTLTARKAVPRQGDPALNAPKGMAYTANRLFVADIDRVVGYDVDSGAQVFEAPLGGDQPALLNDITLADPRTLLVTDSLRGAVYRMDLETKKFDPVATGIPGANGIALESSGKTAYVAASGTDFKGGDLWRLDLTQNPVVPQRVGAVHGVLDGIAVLANGELVISDWAGSGSTPGTVTVHRPDGSEVAKVSLPENLHGPADFTVDPAGRNLWIPAMPDNRVLVVQLLESAVGGTSSSATTTSGSPVVTTVVPTVPTTTTTAQAPSPAPATTP
ncbi:SMP-30/gluconolactonase/LRE family protein [Nocardia jejuensis]|uniref:SMP-30/gluconolactonase/LRE family protein n=1 Tax=Nocardia jejuensis TaxID=328049 RepID=UPI00082DABC4|nr:SMP-30/gluconolactonase/LRE family protein [Nocardia jejuensis]